MAVQAQGARPMWWGLTMFVLSVIYLFPETLFNAELVAVAGGRDSSEEDLRTVELFGRTISGIGVTLLLADLLIRGKALQTKFRALVAFILLAVLVWPLVYFGQKWLVDTYIIHPSTPEQRQQAYYAQVVRSALIRNAVELEGVPYDPDRQHSASEMTFLALFSGMVYADDQLMDKIDTYQESIIRKYVRKSAYQDFDAHYSQYTEMRDEIRASYRDYHQSSQRYNESLAGIPGRTDKYRRQIETDVKKGWDSYKKGLARFNRQVESQAQKIAPRIYDYFDRRSKCRSDGCKQRLDRSYDKQIKSLGLGHIPASYWVQTKTYERDVVDRALTGVLTGGISLLVEAFDGKDNSQVTKNYYTNDVAFYARKLRPKMAPNFKKSSGGYEVDISSLTRFRQHKQTAAKVRKSLRAKGLKLPSNWRISHRTAFERAVRNKVKSEADAKWRSEMARRDMDMPPNLSWNRFQRNSAVQVRIKREMGEENYINPMLMDWNNRQFKRYVVDPNVTRETRRLMGEMNASLPEFADGGSMEEKSKSALRATVVPPISMALSLFLVIMTAMKLPLKGYALWRQAQVRQRPFDAKPAERNAEAADGESQQTTLIWKRVSAPVLNTGATLLMLVLILVLPLSMISNRYTAQDSAVHYFLETVEQSASPIFAKALQWVINTQPLVQPLGAALEQHSGLMVAFAEHQALFDKMDEQVLPEHKPDVQPQVSAVPSESPALLPLNVKANVADARIRVMNIKPRYAPGLKLAPGHYDVEVSAPGYKTERRWITLDKAKTDFAFVLRK